MSRTVFSTTTKAPGASGDGQAAAALEVAVASGKSTVFFHERGGSIYDISSTVTVTGTEPYDLTRALPSENTSTPCVGFTIHITKLSVENEAAFAGTLQRRTGPAPGDITILEWEGTFTMYSDISVQTIQEGIKPLPPAVLSFLAISPLDTASTREDLAMKDTQSMLKQLMTFNLDSWARDWFFHNKDAQMDPNSFSSDWGQAPDAFQLAKISADNHDFLYKAAMHLVCRSLKNSEWLGQDYRNRIKDKVDEFFANIKAKKDTGLTSSYDDCTQRTYMLSFLILAKEQWRNILVTQSAASTLSETAATLSSPNFLAHWVPQNLVAPEFHAGTANKPFMAQLAELKCKLTILKTWAQNSNRVNDSDAEVEKLIAGIQRAAKMSGLLGKVVPDPQAADFKFDIKTIFSDSLQWNFGLAQHLFGGGGGFLGGIFAGPQIDTASSSVHFWLLKDAKDLGLYEWKLFPT